MKLEIGLIADKVIINKKDLPAPAQMVERIQFGNDLASCFGA